MSAPQFIRNLVLSTSVVLSFASISCSTKEDDNLVSHLSSSNYPNCANDNRFNAFLIKAKYCSTFQADSSFDKACIESIKSLYSSLSTQCQIQSRDVIGKTVISSLNSHLNTVQINSGNNLVLDGLATWSRRAALYFQHFSDFFSFPHSNSSDTGYGAQTGLSLLSGKIIKLINLYNSTYPLNKQLDGKPVESAELEVLKVIVDTQGSSVASEIGALSNDFFGFMLIGLLQSQEDKILRLARAHDVTCQFSPCSVNSKPDFYYVIDFFGSLMDPNATSLSSQGVPSLTDALVRNILTILSQPKAATLWTGLKTNLLKSDTRSNYLLESLSQKSRLFQSLTRNFDRTAVFFVYDNQTLRYGLDRDTYLRIPSYIDGFSTLISQRAAEYDSNLSQWQSRLQQQIASESEAFSLGKQIDINSLDQSNLLSDMAGLSNAIKEQENSLGSYLKQVSMIDSRNNLGFTNRLSGVTLTIDKQAVKHDPNINATDVWALSFASIPLNKGEIISGIVEGKWSPTCSVKAVYSDVNMAGVTIGPDGFGISRTASGFKLESIDKSFRETKFAEASVRAEVCANAKAGLNILGSGGGITSSLCTTLSSGTRREWAKGSTSTQGSRLDETAAFQSGLLSPKAPAHRYPAGAILGYIMPKGERDLAKALTVKVMERNFTFLAPQDSDLHLVVNDCLDPALDYGSISAIYDVKEPTEGKMKSYLADMQDLFTRKSTQVDRFLKEGSNITPQLQTLRSEMLAEFATSHTDYATIPLLREFFEYWIDNEGLKLQRKAMRLQKERELGRLVEDAQRLEGLKLASLNSKFVIQESLIRASNQIDYYPINESIDSSLDSLSNQIIPVLKFHQASFTNYAEAAIELRKGLKMSMQAKGLADSLKVFLTSLKTSIIKTQTAEPLDLVQSHFVAIRFPNPDSADSLISLPKADLARSKILWEDMFLPRNDVRRSVSLTFNDLYPYIRPDLGLNGPRAGSIRCSQTRTVIEDIVIAMAVNPFYVTDDIINFVNSDQQTSITLGPRFSFADTSKTSDFALAPNNLGSVRQAKAGLVKRSTPNYTALFSRSDLPRAGAGLSPFTSFQIDGSQFRELLAIYPEIAGSESGRFPSNVSDIIVGFKVMSYNAPVSADSSFITNCSALGG